MVKGAEFAEEDLNDPHARPIDEFCDKDRFHAFRYCKKLRNADLNMQNALLQARKLVQRRERTGKYDGPERIIGRYRKRLLAVCRLWAVVEWFVGDYCETVGSLLHRVNDGQPIADMLGKDGDGSTLEGRAIAKDSLSFSELGRLQRGFVLFDLYRLLRSPTLLRCFTYMETAEVLSIYDYLLERVAEAGRVGKECAYAFYVKEAEVERMKDDRITNARLALAEALESKALKESHWSSCLEGGYQYHGGASLVDRGLPFCKTFLKCMSKNQQTAMLTVWRTRSAESQLKEPFRTLGQLGWNYAKETVYDDYSMRMGLHKLDPLLDPGRPKKLLEWLSHLERDKVSPLSPCEHQKKTRLHKRVHSLFAWRHVGWFIWDGQRFGDGWENGRESAALAYFKDGDGDKKNNSTNGDGVGYDDDDDDDDVEDHGLYHREYDDDNNVENKSDESENGKIARFYAIWDKKCIRRRELAWLCENLYSTLITVRTDCDDIDIDSDVIDVGANLVNDFILSIISPTAAGRVHDSDHDEKGDADNDSDETVSSVDDKIWKMREISKSRFGVMVSRFLRAWARKSDYLDHLYCVRR